MLYEFLDILFVNLISLNLVTAVAQIILLFYFFSYSILMKGLKKKENRFLEYINVIPLSS